MSTDDRALWRAIRVQKCQSCVSWGKVGETVVPYGDTTASIEEYGCRKHKNRSNCRQYRAERHDHGIDDPDWEYADYCRGRREG